MDETRSSSSAASINERVTKIVSDRLAARNLRLMAARSKHLGIQVISFEQAAARLAGGFTRPIDNESLRAAIQAVLPATQMGELEKIKTLPGMVEATTDTLYKVWRAGIDLTAQTVRHPRLDAIARLEAAVLAELPPGMMRPVDIVAAATDRLAHAPAIFGQIEIVGLTELAPCWRPLLLALTAHTPVQWTAGPRSVPAWLEDSDVTISRASAKTPQIRSLSAATAYHEAIEAMRWARGLLASGVSPPEIAIATSSPAEYDDHFLALRSDANFDLHFVHGIRTVTTREGQTAAALADIVVRGLSQSRLRRLVALCQDSGPFDPLPEGWLRVLPTDAPLSNLGAWNRLLARLTSEDWPDGINHAPTLRACVELLAKGPEAAAEIGETLLKGRALLIWRKALLAGPAASIDATLETLKQDDGLEACVCVTWMPASALAASPRRFVRLLGLNSSRWPRGIAEDRLIPDHIIPTPVLDPLPINLVDRRDFETILTTTTDSVILSRARRDSDGRLLGRSALLAAHGDETFLRRNATPVHAFSETDRLMARPQEFAADPQAVSAHGCWRNWRRTEITPHDGLVRADHPLVLAILDRTQSASSLRRLLRNPLSFVWVYAFGWREPQSSAEPLVLDALGIGDLVHMVLDRALRDLETSGGLASADTETIEAAVAQAAQAVAATWESERPIPPAVIWERTLDDARMMAGRALSYGDSLLPGTHSYGEVPFGGSVPKSDAETPWDTSTPVTIPDTGFNIAGYIDRLDIAGDGKRALVRDYKTGQPPRKNIRLNGGRELQRCLYAFAVKALLGDDVSISASLLYPREPIDLQLDDPEAVLAEITGYLRAARASLSGGAALPGPDTGGDYDDLAFALPANAGATYCKHKMPAATERLGEVAQVWEAE